MAKKCQKSLCMQKNDHHKLNLTTLLLLRKHKSKPISSLELLQDTNTKASFHQNSIDLKINTSKIMQNPCRINIRKSFKFHVGLQKLHVLKPGTWKTLENVKEKKETDRIVFLRMDVFSFFSLSSVRGASISPTSLT